MVSLGNYVHSLHPGLNPFFVEGTFSIPITKLPQPDGPNVYHIPTNDHDGNYTDFISIPV